MSNRYTAKLSTSTVEALLSVMRPEVEETLQRYAILTGNAPSQSHRATRLLQKTGAIKSADKVLLQDFLCVHRAVWILEGRGGPYLSVDTKYNDGADDYLRERLQ